MNSTASVIIALVNLGLIIYFFKKRNKKNDSINERNRKLGLLKTLVLDYNLKYLYQFFEDVYETTNELRKSDIENSKKQEINERLTDLGKNLRQKFTDIFLALDKSLYDRILKSSDSLLDGLTNDIFDEGVNLSHAPKFDELITRKISETKTKIIGILFDYSG